MRTVRLALIVLLAPALPVRAGAPFVERATTPYECTGLAAARGADRIWTGRFFGARETGHDDEDGPRGRFGGFFGPTETTSRVYCFVDERSCRNWLYNMQSTYAAQVWRAECRRGAPG